MKNAINLSICIFFLVTHFVISAQSPYGVVSKEPIINKSLIEYNTFQELTAEVHKYRKKRLISLDTFLAFAKDSNTIILDTRSVADFNGRHIEGAINLPLSEFTKRSLRKTIGHKEKRILIYCNNNFKGDPRYMLSKLAPLALNIPTFINLYGYGYEDVYELKELVDIADERIAALWSTDPHRLNILQLSVIPKSFQPE